MLFSTDFKMQICCCLSSSYHQKGRLFKHFKWVTKLTLHDGKYVNSLGLKMYRGKNRRQHTITANGKGTFVVMNVENLPNIHYGVYCAKNNYICYETVKIIEFHTGIYGCT